MIDFQKLAEPFPVDDLEWRFLRSGIKKDREGKDVPWALVVPYVTSRAIQERLDEVCGPAGWQTRFTPFQGGFVCELSILTENGWITKSDGAELTEIEAVKGGISGALKRAAVMYGIGRPYYRLPDLWAVFNPNPYKGRYRGKIEKKWYDWDPPALPKDFVPAGSPTKADPPPGVDPTTGEVAEPVAQDAQSEGPFAKLIVEARALIATCQARTKDVLQDGKIMGTEPLIDAETVKRIEHHMAAKDREKLTAAIGWMEEQVAAHEKGKAA